MRSTIGVLVAVFAFLVLHSALISEQVAIATGKPSKGKHKSDPYIYRPGVVRFPSSVTNTVIEPDPHCNDDCPQVWTVEIPTPPRMKVEASNPFLPGPRHYGPPPGFASAIAYPTADLYCEVSAVSCAKVVYPEPQPSIVVCNLGILLKAKHPENLALANNLVIFKSSGALDLRIEPPWPGWADKTGKAALTRLYYGIQPYCRISRSGMCVVRLLSPSISLSGISDIKRIGVENLEGTGETGYLPKAAYSIKVSIGYLGGSRGDLPLADRIGARGCPGDCMLSELKYCRTSLYIDGDK